MGRKAMASGRASPKWQRFAQRVIPTESEKLVAKNSPVGENVRPVTGVGNSSQSMQRAVGKSQMRKLVSLLAVASQRASVLMAMSVTAAVWPLKVRIARREVASNTTTRRSSSATAKIPASRFATNLDTGEPRSTTDSSLCSTKFQKRTVPSYPALKSTVLSESTPTPFTAPSCLDGWDWTAAIGSSFARSVASMLVRSCTLDGLSLRRLARMAFFCSLLSLASAAEGKLPRGRPDCMLYLKIVPSAVPTMPKFPHALMPTHRTAGNFPARRLTLSACNFFKVKSLPTPSGRSTF
mmetsp:Transcript_10766/g.34353  ORF Transcript_10766/g.34353 Transcript_10766/m.34353 type:complete len:295 (+) Transcript_10766:1243-2127(+)